MKKQKKPLGVMFNGETHDGGNSISFCGASVAGFSSSSSIIAALPIEFNVAVIVPRRFVEYVNINSHRA